MTWLHNPAVLLGAYWVYSAAVSSMPDITTTSSDGYRWLYGFLHAIAGNIDKLQAMRGKS